MASRTNSNRYHNICMVVEALGEANSLTATEISKRVNLSRQAVLDICKQAMSWGWIDGEQYPYRKNVNMWIWETTPHGYQNAVWHMNAYRNAINKKGQLPLL